MPRRRAAPGVHDAPLYIRRISIKNIRSFESVVIDLESDDVPRMWGVILGDNGVGKTTLLRCIAMGLCDAASAAGLLREIYGDWNRHVDGKPKLGKITIEFFPTAGKQGAWIETTIVPGPSGYNQIKQSARFPDKNSKTKDFPWGRIFACGYGAARRSFGTRDIDDYATIDAVYTLFNYDTPLQNPELVFRRLQSLNPNMRPLLSAVAKILMLPDDSVQLSPSGRQRYT